MSEFLAMGGYGAYVWSAYGFAFVVLVGLFWQSRRFARKRVAELEEARRLAGGRRGASRPAVVARRVAEPTATPGTAP